jgi:COMPASS component SDC1
MSESAPQIPEADAQPVANGVAPDATTEMTVDSTAAADITMTDSHDVKTPTCKQLAARNYNETQLESAPAAQPTEPQASTADAEPTTAPTTNTPTPAPAPANAPTPTPAPAPSSRASPHPSAQAQQQPPVHPIPHGSPTRVYLNQHVTPHLLEAMKHLVTAEPEKPLLWLSEFLAGKSREIEG